MRCAMRPALPSCTKFCEENRTNADFTEDMRLGPITDCEDAVKKKKKKDIEVCGR